LRNALSCALWKHFIDEALQNLNKMKIARQNKPNGSLVGLAFLEMWG